MFSNKTYDRLKFIAQIVLPAAGTLYYALSDIWDLPHGPEIVGTIVALDTFLGALLGISTIRYVANTPPTVLDGNLYVTPDKEVYAAVETPTSELLEKGEVTLAVGKLDA